MSVHASPFPFPFLPFMLKQEGERGGKVRKCSSFSLHQRGVGWLGFSRRRQEGSLAVNVTGAGRGRSALGGFWGVTGDGGWERVRVGVRV